jgi:hypothetical protein
MSHKRRTEATSHNQVERSPELVRRIREVNAKDIALYRFVRERLVGYREQWLASRGVQSLNSAM